MLIYLALLIYRALRIHLPLRPLLAGTGCLVTACLVALGSTPAQAASPGWRIVKTFGTSSFLQAMSVDSAADAWICGTTGQSLLVEHSKGGAWQQFAVPAGFRDLSLDDNVSDGAIGATSASDMWTFPAVATNSGQTQYGLHWNGLSWTMFTLRGLVPGVSATAVFSPSNVWVFGQKPAKPGTLGFGPPYTARYDGHAWRQVSMPGIVLADSAPAANDIWAVGPTAATAGGPGAKWVTIAMHWNGKSWASLPLPRLAPVKGFGWFASGIVALSASNVWVSERVLGSEANGLGPAGVALLHWNGKKWTTVTRNTTHYSLGLAGDGHGGFWLSATKAESPTARGFFAHFASGHWTYQPTPTRAGFADSAFELALIPRTRSVWALGSLTALGHGGSEDAIAELGT